MRFSTILAAFCLAVVCLVVVSHAEDSSKKKDDTSFSLSIKRVSLPSQEQLMAKDEMSNIVQQIKAAGKDSVKVRVLKSELKAANCAFKGGMEAVSSDSI